MNEKWLSPKEFGERIGYSDQAVRNMLENGELRASEKKNKRKSYWRIPESEVDVFFLQSINLSKTENIARYKKILESEDKDTLRILGEFIASKLVVPKIWRVK